MLKGYKKLNKVQEGDILGEFEDLKPSSNKINTINEFKCIVMKFEQLRIYICDQRKLRKFKNLIKFIFL